MDEDARLERNVRRREEERVAVGAVAWAEQHR
jgi:hypothetical protein